MKNKNNQISAREFYDGLERTFRENSPPKKLVSGLQYFICVHFNDFSIDFIREFRDRINFFEVYKKFEEKGEVWILRQDEKKFKEFFGEVKWDI